jgi:hypothetical protein
MPHIHYCPDCENNWECGSPDCEKYAAYLCLECFEGLICLKCFEAFIGDDGPTLRKRKPAGGVEQRRADHRKRFAEGRRKQKGHLFKGSLMIGPHRAEPIRVLPALQFLLELSGLPPGVAGLPSSRQLDLDPLAHGCARPGPMPL